MKNILVVFVLVVVILAAGCTGTNQISSPGTPVPTVTAAAISATGQAPPGDLRAPAAAVTTAAPIEYAYKIVNGKKIPYVYERNGHYYLQPAGFVCTETNPQWMSFFPAGNYTYDPATSHEVLWCER